MDAVALTARIALALLVAAAAYYPGFTLSTPAGQPRAVWRGRRGGGNVTLSPRLAFLLVAALLAVGLATSWIALAILVVASIHLSRLAGRASCAEYRRWFAVAVTAAAAALCLIGPGLHSMDHWLSLDGPYGALFALMGVTVALVAAAVVLVSASSATDTPKDPKAALQHYLPI